MASFYDAASGALRGLYDRHVHTPPVLEADRYFPGHGVFERELQAIRSECTALMEEMSAIPQFHELMAEQEPLSKHGGRYWRLYVLRAYGADHFTHQQRCPTLKRLLAADRTVTSAAFSILEGGKHIPAHRGPFRGILRYHLPMVIPSEGPNRLRVDGETFVLREGKGILWDDTYEHEAWNDSREARAVLLLDVFRTGMPAPLAFLTRVIVAGVGLVWRLTGRGRR